MATSIPFSITPDAGDYLRNRLNEMPQAGVAVGVLMVVFAASMYFCDRIPRRIVIRLGLLGWALTIIGGYCFFEIHGP
jgi:hypothetical protein